MTRIFRWYDYITFSIYFFGLTTLSQTLTPLVVPLLVQQFVGEAQQGTFYGTIRLWSLMVALLWQSLTGMLSDRSTLRWGRRRPFIAIGTLAQLVVMALIGFSAGLEGITGYWVLFALLLLSSLSSNTAHGAVQGIIPDLVPEEKRGRFSGVKAILEVPLPVIIVSFTIGKLIAKGNMWGGLLLAMGILVAVMLLTMLVPEKRHTEITPLDWTPFLRLILMTALFTVVILGVGAVVNLVIGRMAGVTDPAVMFGVMFTAGLLAMLLAVGMGVWLSVQVSIGGAARKNPSFAWWVVSRLAFLVGSTNLAGFAVYFLQGRLGLEKSEAAGPASTLIMIVGVFILFLALPSGFLADKFGRKPLLVTSGLLAATGTLVLLLSPSMIAIYIGGILVGMGTGLFYTANWALGTDIVPKAEAGRYLGISNLAGAGAGAVGAYIGGPIADYFTANLPSVPGAGYVVLFAIYGMLFLFSIVALLGVRMAGTEKQDGTPASINSMSE